MGIYSDAIERAKSYPLVNRLRWMPIEALANGRQYTIAFIYKEGTHKEIACVEFPESATSGEIWDALRDEVCKILKLPVGTGIRNDRGDFLCGKPHRRYS